MKYIKTKSDIIKKTKIFFCIAGNAHFSVGALLHFSQKMVRNLKRDCNLTNKYDSKSVFFWQYHSFKSTMFIRSCCLSFSQRMIIGELCWQQWGNLWPNGKD